MTWIQISELDFAVSFRIDRVVKKLCFLYRMTNWILHYVLSLTLRVNMFQQWQVCF